MLHPYESLEQIQGDSPASQDSVPGWTPDLGVAEIETVTVLPGPIVNTGQEAKTGDYSRDLEQYLEANFPLIIEVMRFLKQNSGVTVAPRDLYELVPGLSTSTAQGVFTRGINFIRKSPFAHHLIVVGNTSTRRYGYKEGGAEAELTEYPELSVNSIVKQLSAQRQLSSDSLALFSEKPTTKTFVKRPMNPSQGDLALATSGNPSWDLDAMCAQVDNDIFYPERGSSTNVAKSICSRCLVMDECLDAALERREEFGVWGGLSELSRRVVLSLIDEQAPDEKIAAAITKLRSPIVDEVYTVEEERVYQALKASFQEAI